jgi:hypothetical protein
LGGGDGDDDVLFLFLVFLLPLPLPLPLPMPPFFLRAMVFDLSVVCVAEVNFLRNAIFLDTVFTRSP